MEFGGRAVAIILQRLYEKKVVAAGGGPVEV